VAKQLVSVLVEKSKGLAGIGLWCRRDYDANKVWPRLGFAARAEKVGRSRTGSELTFWWLDHHQVDLFTRADGDASTARIPIVMDASVFFDIVDKDSPDTVESKSLQADWLFDSIELQVTDEIFNEIDRREDRDQRKKHRAQAQSFPIVRHDNARFQEIRDSLRKLFPPVMSPSDESDLHQFAKTIAADIPFFVTRAEDQLSKADALYELHGLTVARPATLIVDLDQLRRESEYRPRRVAGSLKTIHLIKGGQEDALADRFQCDSLGESRHHFVRELTAFLSSPANFKCHAIYDENKAALALLVYGSGKEGILEMPLFRVARGSLAPTVARYLAKHSILTACREKRGVVVVSDTCVSQAVADALHESSFTYKDGRWTRVVLDFSASKEEIVQHVESLGKQFEDEKDLLSEIASGLRETPVTDAAKLAEFESFMWPTKILDAEIPSYIIPIQPGWAQHLFDEHLAGQELFGARADLALNCEAVYYRAKTLCGLTAPARILWYVSQNDDFSGAGSIRASSRLEEFLVDTPKKLYTRYRRLGVYKWRNVYALAKEDVNNRIMAIRFSDTELLTKSILWPEMRNLLTAGGIRSQIQTVTRIPSKLFASLYVRGKQ
jgi:hypothetical protein